MSISFFNNDFFYFNRYLSNSNFDSSSEKGDNSLSFFNSNILIQNHFLNSFVENEEDNFNDFNNCIVQENINKEINAAFNGKNNLCEDLDKKGENMTKEEKNNKFPIIQTGVGIVGGKKKKKDFKENNHVKKNSTEETACSTEKNEQLNPSDKDNNNEVKNSLEEKKPEIKNLKNDNCSKDDVKNNDNQLIENSKEIEINLDNNLLANSDNNKNEDSNKILNKKRKRVEETDALAFNADKILKRIRILTIDSSFLFINKKIRTIYNNDIGKSIIIKQFLQIDKEKLSHSSVEFDKEFLNKKMKEILSDRISKKYTNYPPNKNKELVEILINDKEKGGDYFKELFDLKFVDYLRHINGTQQLDILNGLMKVDEIMTFKDFKIDKDEISIYELYFKKYESLINEKKSRKSKKDKEK